MSWSYIKFGHNFLHVDPYYFMLIPTIKYGITNIII